MKKTITSLFFYILSGVGISLTIKADIGVSSFNSLNVALAAISNSKVGTVTFILNSLFLLLYILLSKQKTYLKYFYMFLAIFSLGSIINFFSYTVLASFVLENYLLKILIFVLGTCIAGFATGIVISLNVLPFPIESVCIRLSELTGYSFARFRYGIDLFSVTFSLALSLFYHFPIFVREGTVISLFLLSGTISLTKLGYENRLLRKKLVES